MKCKWIESSSIVLVVVALGAVLSQAADAPTAPLVLNLPSHTLKGTPADLPTGANIEPVSDKPPTPIQVPKGVINVAAHKPVKSSVVPFLGELSQITDGKREPSDDDAVEFKKGLQWVQVDLGDSYAIHAVAMWHDHRYVQVIHCVILQVSDDPTFKSGVTTLFNNDTENSSGLGIGTDREYFSTAGRRLRFTLYRPNEPLECPGAAFRLWRRVLLARS